MNTRPAAFFTILAGGLFGLIGGCGEAPARAEPPPPRVSVAHPEQRPVVDSDDYNGWIGPIDSVEIRSRVRGHIQRVCFEDGQIVERGSLLFELDPRPFEAEIGRAKDQTRVFRAQAVAAQREAARLRELLQRGGASQSQVDKAEADAASLDAQILASEQEVIRTSLDLEYSRITSPISGRVSRAMLTEGNLVNAGGSDPLLTTIVSVNRAYVYFTVDERALQRFRKMRLAEAQSVHPAAIKESQIRIHFGLETDERYPREGVLDFADNQVDRATGTILVRAIVPDPEGELIAGSRVRVRVPIGQERPVMLVPDTAILTDQDKRYVLVVGDDNVVQRCDLRPGKLLDDGMRVVAPAPPPATPLKPEDRVIIDGLQTARVNYPVEPVTPQGTAATQPAQAMLPRD